MRSPLHGLVLRVLPAAARGVGLSGPAEDGSRIRFVEAGTVRRPGPIGRGARLLLGLACAWALVQLVINGPELRTGEELTYFPGWWLVIGFGLWAYPDVVNIGFGLEISRRRLWWMLAGVGGAAAIGGWLGFGSIFSPPLGIVVYVWLWYTFGHLGLALLVAAAMGTPGCEMRSLPELWGRVTGHAAREHYCPGVFSPIDDWEAGKRD